MADKPEPEAPTYVREHLGRFITFEEADTVCRNTNLERPKPHKLRVRKRGIGVYDAYVWRVK